jgi:prepilin-type N-terminal cleavage/methylation domain-containing protein
MQDRKRNNQGFTLVELLVVIGIIVILFAVILVAIDPAQRLQQARDAVRQADTRDILESLQLYVVDNDGILTGLDIDTNAATFEQIGTATTGCDTGCTAQTTIADCSDLTSTLVDGYLSAIPMDPSSGTAAETDYYVNVNASGRVIVGSCDPEIEPTIEVSR